MKKEKITCKYCGKKIEKYHKKQDVCGKYSCRMKYLEETNPILAKTKRITSNIRLKNKTEIVSKMIEEALGKPCEYCGEIITLKNLSIDHKIPIKHRKVAKGEYSKKELEELNKPENLHIICKRCNDVKSDLTDEEFRELLSFLKDKDDLRKKIINRLRRSQNIFKR